MDANADTPDRTPQTIAPSQDLADPRILQALQESGLQLVRDAAGLALTDGTLTVRADFASMLPRLNSRALSKELLVKAAKVKHVATPCAIDATAGLGQDSLLLAAAGFTVTLCERNPVIAALLRDAVERARELPGLADAAGRMQVVEGDSLEVLAAAGTAESGPDVVVLDPMFPGRHKHAQVKKKLQLLQRLEQPCDDEEVLLQAALDAHPRKVVVKRPAKGPYLAGRKPDYSLAGKAVRYDCFACAPRSV